jgi:hypothetical protein
VAPGALSLQPVSFPVASTLLHPLGQVIKIQPAPVDDGLLLQALSTPQPVFGVVDELSVAAVLQHAVPAALQSPVWL